MNRLACSSRLSELAKLPQLRFQSAGISHMKNFTPPAVNSFRQTSSWLLAAATAVGILSSFPAAAAPAEANWPHWRGPLDNGVAPQATPPSTWSESKNVQWKVKLPGSGTATPIIWNNQVFIQTAINAGKKADAATSKVAALAPNQFMAAPAPDAPPPGGQPGRRRPGGPGGRAAEAACAPRSPRSLTNSFS